MISIGFDIGGTNTKIVVMNNKYKVLDSKVIKTPIQNGYKNFITTLVKIAKDIKAKYPDDSIKICLAIAGDVDSEKGILRFAPNLNKWKDKRIKNDFQSLSGFKTFLENDANMAAWGIYVFELKRKPENICVFTLGTGVGGGIIIDSKLYKGTSFTAGEFGHMVIKYDGRKCNCGNYGCLEAYCSTYWLVEEFKKRVKNYSTYLKKYGYDDVITPEVLYNLALKGDEIAVKLWMEYGYNLGTGIGNIAVILNPQLVALTGGVSKAARFFLPSVKKRLNEYKIKTPVRKMEIHISSMENIGVLGAASFAIENE